MCPKQSQEAWKQMKKLRNGDFERAVELENAVRQKDRDLYFHKLGLPLQVAVPRCLFFTGDYPNPLAARRILHSRQIAPQTFDRKTSLR